MKYLKFFEDYKFHEDKYGVSYSFTYEGFTFDVFFQRYPGNVYERRYKDRKDDTYTSLINKNPFVLIKQVTNITKEFLEEYKPDKLIIKHEGFNKNLKPDELNSRAKLNYRYLKNIKGYSFNYSNSISLPGVTILTLEKI